MVTLETVNTSIKESKGMGKWGGRYWEVGIDTYNNSYYV